MRRTVLLFTFFVILLSACNFPGEKPATNPDQDLVGTVVAATFQAMTQVKTPQASPLAETATPAPPPVETITPTPTVAAAKVSGKVCYHDKSILALTIYFQDTGDEKKLWSQTVSRPAETYSIELPPGKYRVYAWAPDYTIGALAKDRPTIDVALGTSITGLDLCDYSQGPFAVPYPPGFSPSKERGSISGVVFGYQGSERLTVVSFNQTTGYWYYTVLLPGQTEYEIKDLPAGRYRVVAYGEAGAAAGADDVYVVAGKNTVADVSNWDGSYPSNPVH